MGRTVLCQSRFIFSSRRRLRLGTHLLQQQFPVDADRSLTVFATVFAQSSTHLAHSLEGLATVQEIFNILGHDFAHVLELVVELVEVLRRPRILIRLFRSLNEGVKLDIGVWAARRTEILLRRVRRGEFVCNVGEIGKGELAGV
jgi:hypothetical protein